MLNWIISPFVVNLQLTLKVVSLQNIFFSFFVDVVGWSRNEFIGDKTLLTIVLKFEWWFDASVKVLFEAESTL